MLKASPLALLSLLCLPLSLRSQKTLLDIPDIEAENMVRTDPITENLANMKLSFGASPGPVVRPTEVKNDFLLSWRILAKRMLSRHRQREFIWAALRKEKKPCRASLPRSPTVRSGKTRPASPPSPPRSKKRQEPSWARMTPPA